MTEIVKKYSTIGCCGIDCGLCPRFHTKGDSACPGCCGANFKEKHPSCGFVTCCVIKKGFEQCSDCKEYPCNRFDSEKAGYDSFVTHQKVFANLEYIKVNGIDCFVDQQKIRMDILTFLLNNYDDGRSKTYFCISCALLPFEELLKSLVYMDGKGGSLTVKEKNKLLKSELNASAENLGIQIKLNHKK